MDGDVRAATCAPEALSPWQLRRAPCYDIAMPDLVVFNILIPRTENATGVVHAPAKFDAWLSDTVERFGGVTIMGLGLRGLWFDPALPRAENPVEDFNNWYKVGVEQGRVDELREYVRETAHAFGQKCLYFERAGEAEFVWDPAHQPRPAVG